jgi:AcrR family transcriptional regulator
VADAPRRKHDSEATKAALLQAAAELFAERGFDQTTVRDVGARAGVNQALLFRYFGSKQELFAEVLNHHSKALLDELPAEELPERILAGILSPERSGGGEHQFVGMLRSFSDERAAQLLREELGGRYTARLAELSDAPDAELRADLVLAWLFGLGMVRSVLRKQPLVDADTDAVADHLMRAISVLLERVEPNRD